MKNISTGTDINNIDTKSNWIAKKVNRKAPIFPQLLPLQNLYQLPVQVFWKVKEKLETHFVITQIQHIRRPVISWAIQL